jgi:hypothetical protein
VSILSTCQIYITSEVKKDMEVGIQTTKTDDNQGSAWFFATHMGCRYGYRYENLYLPAFKRKVFEAKQSKTD